MSKIKRYGEEVYGEDGFQKHLDEEMEKSHGRQK